MVRTGELINEQHPDLIFFNRNMVNDYATRRTVHRAIGELNARIENSP